MSLEFDPFEAVEDPYPLYRALREQAPVFRSASGIVCLSRYEDVRHVLSRPERFSSTAMQSVFMKARAGQRPPFKARYLVDLGRLLWRTRFSLFRFGRAGNLITLDPPRHDQLRSIVNRGFSPRQIAGWEPRIRGIVDEEIGGRLDAGEGLDVVRDLAIPLPTRVICEMLGVEPARRDDFKRWSDAIISMISGPARENPIEHGVLDEFGEMWTFLRETVRRRRREPGDDLVSLLVDPRREDALDEAHLIQFVLLLLVAGNETTTNLIGNGTNALFDHPDQLERLCADPSLLPNMLEEALRFDPPIQIVFRIAREDTEIGGVAIPKDTYVAPILAAANRDPARFDDPDAFDIGRDARGHLGFGFGLHFCLGASLARLEARAAMESLLPHLRRLQRSQRAGVVDSFLVRGRTELHLEAA